MKQKTALIFFLATLILGQGVCCAQVLNAKQTQALKCAEEKIYAVYNF